MNNVQHIWCAVKETAFNNFKSATMTFLLIMLVVNGFQVLFGPENSVLGLIIAPMMLVLMARDMTAHPVRHFLRQALILCGMASAACFSTVMPAPVALLLHVAVIFFLLYTYTCDYGDHMYFQYILNYLFLIFIGPIAVQQLPLRLLGMIAGAGCLLLYQCIKGRDRISAATRNAMLALMDDTKSQIESLLCGDEPPHENATLGNALKIFCQTMEHRRKTMLALSNASIATMETVLSLEKLNVAFRHPTFVLTTQKRILLRSILTWLNDVPAYFLCERDDIPQIPSEVFGDESSDAERFYQWTLHLHTAFLAMRCPDNRRHFCKAGGSLLVRLKLAVNFSPVRFTYALRLSFLLAIGILLVQYFHLDHGKWLLFTLASVSLPYSDDVWTKGKKRFIATLIGGSASLILFSLIPSTTGKMVAMLFSGYLSCYMTDYLPSFSCGTVGALGGAVIAIDAAGFIPVGGLVLTRIVYIAAGIIIAVACNCFVFPTNQKLATRDLARKYIQTTQALSESYRNLKPDLQLHYHLLLQMHRLENKLQQNSKVLHWDEVHSFLLRCQTDAWQACKTSA